MADPTVFIAAFFVSLTTVLGITYMFQWVYDAVRDWRRHE